MHRTEADFYKNYPQFTPGNYYPTMAEASTGNIVTQAPGISDESTASCPSSTRCTRTLDVALAEAITRFAIANPKSKDIYERASKHLPAGNTRTTLFSAPFPLAVPIASGAKVRSADGDVYTDFVGEYTAAIYGHSHPDIINALEECLGNGINFGATSPLEGEFAARLKKRFEKAGLEMLRFTNSGTEANLMAIQAAKAWTGRSKVLVFTGGYHGSVLGFPTKEKDPMRVDGDFIVAKYNDYDDILEMKSARKLLKDDLAAILVEPMQGAGGCFPAHWKWLKMLREWATKDGIVLIHDEVMTSRLHYDGGLSGKYEIKPDLITMGKYLGGGMSFGLFGGRKDIMSMFDPVNGQSNNESPSRTMKLTHSGTFNNNVMTMTAGIAGVKILTPELLQSVNERGDYLRSQLSVLLVENGFIKEAAEEDLISSNTVPRGKIWVSGIGSMNHVHFGEKDELDKLRDLFYFHLVESKIYSTRRGFVVLTIQHTKEDVDSYVDAVKSFIEQYGHF